MPGPVPNPKKIQRSKHDAWDVLDAEGRTTPAPELEGTYSARAVRLWNHWWSTPMALKWGEFDSPILEELLGMMEVVWSGEYTAAHLGRIGRLETDFGLSPAARRKLYWKVEGVDTPAADAALDAPAAEAPLPSAGSDEDPRKLRSVS